MSLTSIAPTILKMFDIVPPWAMGDPLPFDE